MKKNQKQLTDRTITKLESQQQMIAEMLTNLSEFAEGTIFFPDFISQLITDYEDHLIRIGGPI